MRIVILSLSAALCVVMALPAIAADSFDTAAYLGSPSCCASCGCQAACREVTCQVVCDVKKVTKTCWSYKCEEYCLPRPKLWNSCNSCGDAACNRCCKPQPTCGKLRVKKKLLKKTFTVEVPIYKCVVKNLCEGCEGEATKAATTARTPLPPAPAPSQQALDTAPLPPLSPALLPNR